MLPNSYLYITIPLLLKKDCYVSIEEKHKSLFAIVYKQWNYPCSFQSDYDFFLSTCDNKKDGSNRKKQKSFSYATNKRQ